ncbi:MAG: DUF5995 family protein [Ilumatobacteraceae bacterium]
MLEETIDELRSVALGANDASGYFAAMYARVTDRVQAAIISGRFGDGDQMARFATTFVDWYLGPQRRTRPLPRCWAAAEDVAGDTRLVIVQQLLLGINAHVNHDLPQVVVELADTGFTLDELRPGFDAINDLLAQTQPDILRDLGRVSGWTHIATFFGGGRLFNFSLDRARAQAWQAAVRMQPLDANARRDDVAELDRIVSVLAYLITRPGAPFKWVVPIAKWFEGHDCRVVTRQLLGPLA